MPGSLNQANGTSLTRAMTTDASGNVFVTGNLSGSVTFDGTRLTSLGGNDLFVAKYVPATGTWAWAASGGGTGSDIGYGVAVSSSVYVTGYVTPSASFGPASRQNRLGFESYVTPSASFGSYVIATPAGAATTVLARLVDNTLESQPLPVQLVAFAATASGPAAVRLTWATVSEKNSARFEVERSPDSVAYATVGMVAAAGTTAATHTYALLAAALPAGAPVLYYRLRQVDLNGSFTYSPVWVVALGGAGLVLFPNPTLGYAAKLSGAAPGQPVQVYDAVGRLVLSATADAGGTAGLALPASLPGGEYVGAQALRLAVEAQTLRLAVE